MKVTTKTKYALLSLSEFDREEKIISIRQLSEKYSISKKYLERIFCDLESCGIVEGKRGPKGGYKLSKPPSQITLKDIIEGLEKEVKVMDCEGIRLQCPFNKDCKIIPFWKNLNKLIEDYLGSVTLEQILRKEVENGS